MAPDQPTGSTLRGGGGGGCKPSARAARSRQIDRASAARPPRSTRYGGVAGQHPASPANGGALFCESPSSSGRGAAGRRWRRLAGRWRRGGGWCACRLDLGRERLLVGCAVRSPSHRRSTAAPVSHLCLCVGCARLHLYGDHHGRGAHGRLSPSSCPPGGLAPSFGGQAPPTGDRHPLGLCKGATPVAAARGSPTRASLRHDTARQSRFFQAPGEIPSLRTVALSPHLPAPPSYPAGTRTAEQQRAGATPRRGRTDPAASPPPPSRGRVQTGRRGGAEGGRAVWGCVPRLVVRLAARRRAGMAAPAQGRARPPGATHRPAQRGYVSTRRPPPRRVTLRFPRLYF